MPDLDIDQLNIRISSDSKTAEQSLTNLTAALTNLKDSLSKVGSSAKAVSKLADSFSRLKDSAKDIDLSGLASQLSTISRINIKDTGIASFINSMKNFDKVSKNLDFSAIQELKTQLSGLSGVSSNVSELLKSTASFARASGKMQEAAQNFPGLASAIRDFFDSMAGVDVSDNTVRMAEALSQISQNGKRAGAAMQSVQTNTGSSVAVTSRAERVWKLFGDTLKETGSMLKDIGQSIASLAKNIGSGLVSGVKTLVSQFKQLTSASSGLKNLAANLKMLLGTFVGFYGIRSAFNWVKDAVTSGADVAETNHIIEATFGDMAAEVDEWSQKTMENYGIAENAAKRYAGTLGAVFQSSGVGMKESAEMSQRLVEIAGDLSSFYNIDTETVYTKLKSGMAGMVRPLRDVGIDLSVASLSAFALEQGITKSWQSMSQAEKIALRYQYILQATSVVNNDFKNTSGSLANALRTLRAYGQAITETFGDGLASALRHVVRWLNKVAAVVLKVAKVFATFMHTLFGKNISGGGAGLGLSEDDSPYEDVADDLGDAATSAGDTSDGLGDAADNARELAKSLSVLPFDELNQLNKDVENTGSSSSKPKSGGSSPGGLGDLGLPDMGMLDEAEKLFDMSKLPDAVNRWAQRIRKAFEAHDWIGLGREIAWGINKGLEKLYQILDPKNVEEKVLPWVRAFATTMNSLVDNINWDLLGRVLGRGLNDLFLIANTWLTSFGWENLGRKFAEGANGLVSEIRWDWMGEVIGNGINSLWQRAYGFVSTFNWHSLGVGLSVAFRSMVDTIDFKAISGTITEGLNGIITAYNGFIASFPATSLGVKLGNCMKEIINGVHADELGDAIAITWNKVWRFLATTISQLGDDDGKGTGVGAALREALDHIITGVQTEDMTDAISTLVQKIFEDISTVFGDRKMWAMAGQKFGQAIGDLLSDEETWHVAANAINDVARAIIEFFGNVFSELENDREKIAGNFRKFLTELDWGAIFKVVGGVALAALVKEIPMLAGWALLKKEITTQLSAIFKQAAQSEEIVSSGKNIFSPLKAALGEPTLTGGGIIALLMIAGSELSKFQDALAGGNGMTTPEGMIIDKYIEKLRESGEVSEDVLKKIFDLKEQWENGEIEAEEFGTAFVEALEGGGVSTELATQKMMELQSTGYETEESMGLLKSALDKLPESITQTDNSMEIFGMNGAEAAEEIKTALGQVDNELGKQGDGLQGQFSQAYETYGYNAVSALTGIINTYKDMGLYPEQIRQKIDDAFGEGTYDKLIEATENAASKTEGLETKVGSMSDVVSTAGTLFGAAQSYIDNWSSSVKSSGDNAKGAAANAQSFNEATEKTPSLMDTVKNLVSGFASMLLGAFAPKTDYVAKGKEIPEGTALGITEAIDTADEAITTMGDSIVSQFSSEMGIKSPSTVFKSMANYIPQGVAEGIKLGTQVVKNAVKTMCDEMLKQFKTSLESIKTTLKNTGNTVIRDGLVNGFKSALNAFNPGTEISNAFQSAWTTLDNIKSQMYTNGANIIDSGLSSGLRDGLYRMDIASEISSAFDGVWSALDSMEREMYDYGSRIGEALGDGMKNAHIDAPHIDIVDWGYAYYGDGGSVSYPIFDVSWYARGALFTNPAIVGVGEAGDEAALPLENRRTMSRIARAIVDNSDGAFDIDEATLVSAVARGYVQAMMANQGNEKPINVYATLYTEDNEVLARAVQRGNQSIDYRNNPTPRYSY